MATLDITSNISWLQWRRFLDGNQGETIKISVHIHLQCLAQREVQIGSGTGVLFLCQISCLFFSRQLKEEMLNMTRTWQSRWREIPADALKTWVQRLASNLLFLQRGCSYRGREDHPGRFCKPWVVPKSFHPCQPLGHDEVHWHGWCGIHFLSWDFTRLGRELEERRSTWIIKSQLIRRPQGRYARCEHCRQHMEYNHEFTRWTSVPGRNLFGTTFS